MKGARYAIVPLLLALALGASACRLSPLALEARDRQSAEDRPAEAAGGRAGTPAPVATPKDVRQAVIRFAESTVGWTEKTGRNDGPNVDRILGSVGLAGTRNP